MPVRSRSPAPRKTAGRRLASRPVVADGYRGAVASFPAAEHEPRDEDLALRSIRDALLPEEVGDFDREFRQVMLDATETLDLTEVLAFTRRWRRVARSSADADAHRRMLEQAEALNAGSEVPTEPWSTTKARLGL